MITLEALEGVIDASGVAPRIEAMLPIGVRARQLKVRTLLAGMCLAQADHRPAHLTRVHQALVSLPAREQRRLGVITDWRNGPHQLTYRQTEYTFGLVADALAEDEPGGLPSQPLQAACDDLLEASIPEEFKDASTSLAVDWTDMESFSRPPPARGGPCADPEASWGHRKNNLLRSQDELFYGYYLSAGIMMREENGPAVPEFARRATLSSCRHDPVRTLVPVLTAMPAAGIPLGDILADSGYAHRDADAWALPLRAAGAQLVQDLHPHDRGPKGTHHGAIIANGSLYCPCTPRSLLQLGPLARDATREQAAAHDTRTAELARYKLGRLTRDDPDGYHRVQCPAAMGKIRCPLRPSSMTLDRDRPEILQPPEHPPACCTQQTLTVPPEVTAKTAQKHDYPSAAHRRSYARRNRRRTRLRHRQGPRHQRHQPRLVPPHGPDTAHAFRSDAAHRPQPAHPRRLGHPAGRERAAGRRRAPAKNPQTAPQDAHRARHRHPAALAGEHAAPATNTRQRPDTARRQRQHARKPPGRTSSHRADTNRAQNRPRLHPRKIRAGMSDLNVKIVPTET